MEVWTPHIVSTDTMRVVALFSWAVVKVLTLHQVSSDISSIGKSDATLLSGGGSPGSPVWWWQWC